MEITGQQYEWIVGALFIIFFAYQRYNRSSYVGVRENRISTTFERFFLFFFTYILALLAIYWFFGSFIQTSPNALEMLGAFGGTPLPSDLTKFTGPIAAALLLTALLPNLPYIQKVDRWLLQRFWDLGHIPEYVFRQSERLQSTPLEISSDANKEIVQLARLHNIPVECLKFESDTSIEYSWVKLAHLVLQLKKWLANRGSKYERFINQNISDYRALQNDFKEVSYRVAAYQESLSSRHKADPSFDKLVASFQEQVATQVDFQYGRYCLFLAQGIFHAELTERRRQKLINSIGFRAKL